MIKMFKVSGFSLFESPVELSLVPAEKKKNLTENVIRLSNTKRFLKSSVIYGSNNSGKSSLVNALKAFKDIVLAGTIEDFVSLRQIPFSGNNDEVHFEINFVSNSKDIVYGIKFKNEISIGEYLLVNKVLYFKRDENGLTSDLDDKTFLNKVLDLQSNKLIVTHIAKELKGISHIPVASGLVIDQFTKMKFIDNGLPNISLKNTLEFSQNKQRLEILNAFIENSNLYFNKRELLSKDALKEKANAYYLDSNQIDRSYFQDIKLDDIDAIISGNRIVSEYNLNKETKLVPSYVYDSTGTNKLINIAMHIINAILDNEVLVIDNFENNIHFEIAKALLALMNSEVNSSSQFILTTVDQRVTTLNSLRTDQVNIMVRDNEPTILRLDQNKMDINIKQIDITNIINLIHNNLG